MTEDTIRLTEAIESPSAIRHLEQSFLSLRESFLLAVSFGALMADLAQGGKDAQTIMSAAMQIREARIPADAVGAANEYLQFIHNQGAPADWMFIGEVHCPVGAEAALRAGDS